MEVSMPEIGGPHFLLHMRCPGCRCELQFHPNALGQSRQCPKCKTLFRVTSKRATAGIPSSEDGRSRVASERP
jgi:phage FluMu protein Com